MKKICSIVAFCVIFAFTNCSKPAINNDPVIGIWTNVVSNQSMENTKSKTEFEWIFNDAYLGRYHQYTNNNLIVQTDFSWKKENDVYTISYPGTDIPDEEVKLIVTTLQKTNGAIFAIRE
ncbi:hypothetical protein [Cellulophaga sp. Hel_I_12]|uniref:hypothetical protein n=1 Tax=Cellulophaga sp. Hel_I_12 TaxID=1249972 RepID=UPI000647308C|nr:hypothetical protein [Cellulophaga sp. Hel_I_12]